MDVFIRFIAVVAGFVQRTQRVSAGLQGIGHGAQVLGVQLGILSIQFEQFSKLVIGAIEPILEEGIKLQSALDDVRAVAPDLNEKFQRFTRVSLTASEAVKEIASSLQRVSGRDLTANIEAAANGLGEFTESGEETNKFLQALSRELAGAGPEVSQFREDVQTLVSAGATLTQAIRSAAANRGFAALKAQIVDLAETTRFTAIEIAESAKFLALAGLDSQEISTALPATLNLAAAGALELGRAADIATDNMLAFRLEAFSLTGVMDSLAVAAASSNTSVEQLSQGLKFVAPFASALGFSLEETVAALGKLADVGIKGTLAGNSLANAFRALVKRGDNFNAVLAELNLTFNDLDPSQNTLVDIIRTLERSGASVNQIIRAFSIRGGRAISSLVNQGADELEILTKAIEEADFTALDVAATRIENVAGQLLLIRSQLSAIASSVFDTIREDAETLLAVVSEAIKTIRHFIVENQDLVRVVVRVAVVLGAVSTAFAGFLVLVSGPLSLAGLIAAFVAFADVLLPIIGIMTVLAPVIAAAGVAIAAFGVAISSAIKDNLLPLKQILFDITSAIKAFGEGLKEGFSQSLPAIRVGLQQISGSVGGLLAAIRELFRALGAESTFRAFGSDLGTAAGAIAQVIVKLTDMATLIATVYVVTVTRATRLAHAWFLSLLNLRDSIILVSEAMDGKLVSSAKRFEQIARRQLEIQGLLKDAITGGFDPDNDAVSATVAKQFVALLKLDTAVKEVSASLNQLKRDSLRGVELLQDFQTAPLKNLEELLGIIQNKLADTGKSNFLEAIQEEMRDARNQLQRLQAERDKLVGGGIESPQASRVLGSIDREIAALKLLVQNYEQAEESIQDFSEGSELHVSEFEAAVTARLNVLKARVTDLGREFEFLNQTLSDLREENISLELDLDVAALGAAGKEVEAKIKETRDKASSEMSKLSQEITAQQKIIDAVLEQLLIERTAQNERILIEETEKIRELQKRKALLEQKLQNDLAKIQAEEAAKQQEEKEKLAEEEARRKDALLDLEIDALRAQGKDKLAIEKEIQRERLQAEEEFVDLGLEGKDLAEARANLEISLAAKRKQALDALNNTEAKSNQLKERSVGFERDIFKSLSGEVKNARDLFVLFLALNQLRRLRFKFAEQAARQAINFNEKLVDIEEKLQDAKERGDQKEVERLQKQARLQGLRTELARANAENQLQALGLDQESIAGIFKPNEEDVQENVQGRIANIFKNAPALWARAFSAAFDAQAAIILGKVQALVARVRATLDQIGGQAAAAGDVPVPVGVGNIVGGALAGAFGLGGQGGAIGNLPAGIGAAAAGLFGGVAEGRFRPPGDAGPSKTVSVIVQNPTDVDKVRRAISSELNRNGFRMGDI